METNLNSLTTGQLAELQAVVSLLANQFRPEKIICFGCLSASDKASGCFMQATENLKSHYFLLLVTKDATRVEFTAQDYINTHYDRATITIIAHGSKTISEAINKASRFFTTVYRNGTLLYITDGMMPFQSQPLPDIDPLIIVQKAKKQYKYRWTMASGFLEVAATCREKGFFNNSAFLLHQAVEQTCIALIRVFTGYRPDIHNLDRLLKLCLCFYPELSVHFPRNTVEEIRLFRLLNASYSNARYKEDFDISADDADSLIRQVDDFMILADVMCQRKIEDYETLAILPHEHAMDYNPALTAEVLKEN